MGGGFVWCLIMKISPKVIYIKRARVKERGRFAALLVLEEASVSALEEQLILGPRCQGSLGH